ncbi:MAG: LexA family transcriptional regulator [Firmicutes bacterium]|nr:LexA family transcriptional regulator [Bacillota bacterium]
MYDIFDQLLKERGLSAYKVAKATGITTATLSSWKKGVYQPKPDKLQKLADYFGVRLEYLMGNSPYRTVTDMENAVSREHKKGVKIPVLGEVAAGIPIEMVENIVDWEEITPELARTGEFFGVRVKGNSMSPRIAEGDTLIVRKQDTAETNDIVIVAVNGDSATCKRLIKRESGISLISFNPMYAPIEFTNEEIVNKPVTILGKVVENRQKY